MNTHRITLTATLALAVLLGVATQMFAKPNVVLIVCDDLNDFVTGMGGHPQARTPNIEKLAETGVSFRRAYCNVPVCAPSRSSFMTGIYAHTSRNMHFKNWRENRALANCMTLTDLYPTLKDLCGLKGKTLKSDKWSLKLEGHSMRPFLVDPESRTWTGPDFALSMITAQGAANDPAKQHVSVRTERWRYIRYNNGAEELYDHANDPYEWTNLAAAPEHAAIVAEMKRRLPECVPR